MYTTFTDPVIVNSTLDVTASGAQTSTFNGAELTNTATSSTSSIDKVAVKIDSLALRMRPRAPHEAADLGGRLCQARAREVYRCYLAVDIPLGLLSLSLFDSATMISGAVRIRSSQLPCQAWSLGASPRSPAVVEDQYRSRSAGSWRTRKPQPWENPADGARSAWLTILSTSSGGIGREAS